MAKANSGTIVRKANTFLVLDTIRAHEVITVEGIIGSIGLSRPTVMASLRELEKKRIVKRSGFAPAEVGRQPILYGIDSGSHFAIGLDVDGPPVRLAIADLSGQLLHSRQWELPLDASLDQIASSILTAIDVGTTELGITLDQVIGVGLGLPASVDIKSNRAINMSRLEALRDAPLDKMISGQTGLRVDVRNDAHLMALEEITKFAGAEDCLYIAHRTGVGLAIVLGGKVYEGQTGNAGFIGHTMLDPNAALCYCGARGCLEALTSKRAIIDAYQKATGHQLAYSAVLDAAARGESAAIDVVTRAGRYLGTGIANLIKITDIYTVIIGDLGCGDRHIFFRTIAETVREDVAVFLRKAPRVVVGKADPTEFALGGCRLEIEQFFEQPRLRLKA